MEDRVCAGEARAAGGKTGHENGAASRCRPSTIVGELSWPIHERSELDAMISGSGVANLLGIAILRRARGRCHRRPGTCGHAFAVAYNQR